jgi:hypothetical protein
MATTWDPANTGGLLALSAGNMVATSSAGSGTVNSAVRATTAISATIKQYFEVTVSGTLGQYYSVGVMNGSAALNANVGATNGADWVNKFASPTISRVYLNAIAQTGSYPPLASAQVLRVAVDRSANRVWWAINNVIWGSTVWMGSGATNDDPATGTGGLNITSVTGTVFPAFSSAWTGDIATVNFGATAFAFAVPSGFVSIDPLAAGTQARVMVLA